jgi:hypothetical protein
MRLTKLERLAERSAVDTRHRDDLATVHLHLAHHLEHVRHVNVDHERHIVARQQGDFHLSALV